MAGRNGRDSRFKNKVYVVLGATGGIGSELVSRLHASGARLTLVGRSESKLKELAGLSDSLYATVDPTSFQGIDEAFTRTLEERGRIDGAVNCIGSMFLKPAHLTSDPDWYKTLHVNLGTAFATVRAGAASMMRSGGSIVLISSAAARVGLANHEAIAAAKAGVAGLTLAAAATYCRRKIRVNCVAPGLVKTELTRPLTSNEVSLKASEAMHALGRLGEPSDVVAAVEWLLSDDAMWVTGQVIGVDGGLASLRPKAVG